MEKRVFIKFVSEPKNDPLKTIVGVACAAQAIGDGHEVSVFFAASGTPLILLGVPLGALGPLLSALGSTWAALGRSWDVLGRSWAALGSSWAVLECS